MVTMSKDTNFSRHPVLSQIIKLINRDKVNELATTTKVNRYVKSFDAFTHLVVMIYAALSGAKSIRQVVEGFEANVTRLNHLGIAYLKGIKLFSNFIGKNIKVYVALLFRNNCKSLASTKGYVLGNTSTMIPGSD